MLFQASPLLGAPIDGTWKLRVFDDQSGGFAGIGRLDDWSISITRLPGFTTTFAGPGTIGAVSYASNIATATVTNVPVGLQSYTATTTNLIGCSTTSAPAIVTVNPTPTVDAVGNVTYCPGDAGAAINFTGSVSGTDYNWTSTIDVGFGTSGIGDIAAFTAANATSTAITTTVTVTPVASGCPGTEGTFTVTVNPKPTISATNTAQPPICSGTAIANIVISNPNGVSGTTFNWTRDNTTNLTGMADSGNSSPISGTLTNTTNTDQTTVFTIRATSSIGCFSETTATVTVKPTPTIDVPATLATCSGQAITPIVITNPNGVLGTTFSWTRTVNANLSGIGLSGNGSPITGTFINSAATPQSTTFTITATVNGCSSSTTTVVTVSPGSTVNAIANTTYCSGTSASAINFTGTAGASFTWTSTEDVGFGTSGTGSIPAYTATNPGTTPLVATVNVIPTLNGCPGTPVNFTVTVNPTPPAKITANYCPPAPNQGKIELTASGGSGPNPYTWSTGQLTNQIYVDIADIYTVIVRNTYGCQTTAFTPVSNEMVVNGDFELGPAGISTFWTEYGYRTAPLGTLGYYGIGTDARPYYPPGFRGAHDHTSGSGYFMIVDGTDSSKVVWQQDIIIKPNTNYYFSAWGLNLYRLQNPPNYDPSLRFRINGQLVGSTVVLNQFANNDNNPWIFRFYGMWNSGSATTARVQIRDLTPGLYQNDFGLDDISFGTLDPIPATIATITNNGPKCEGETLNLSVTITGGKDPIIYSWTGPNGFTSLDQNPDISNATESNAGVYNLTVTDGYGCSTSVGSTTVVINPVPSGTIDGTTSVCINAAPPLITFTGSLGTAPYTFTYNVNGGVDQTITTVSGDAVTLQVPTGTAGTFLYTLTNVTDANGCSKTLSLPATVTVYDLPVCTITGANSVCPNSTGNIYSATAGMTSYDWSIIAGNPTIVGALDGESVTVSAGSDCNSSFTLSVTVTNPGCSSTCTYTVNTIDNQAPVITGTLTPLPVEGCDISSAPAALTTIAALKALPGAITISDNCTTEDNLIVTHTDASTGTCPVVLTRTYTVTDACGKSSTIDHIINISDTQAPGLTGTLPGGAQGNVCLASAPAAPALATIAALYTDNCSTPAISLTNTVTTGDNCNWTVTYTYNITDGCNTITADVVYTGGDTEAPHLTGTLPGGAQGNVCLANAPAAPAVATIAALYSDNCATPSAVLTNTVTTGDNCNWTVTYTYTITDGCNSITADVVYTGGDTEAPILSGTLPGGDQGNVCLASAPAAPAVATIAALYTDNCSTPSAVLTNTVTTGTNCNWTVTYTYTITDGCNPVTADVVYTGVDTQAPVIAGSLTPATVEGCNISALPSALTTVAQLEALPGAITITDACTLDASLTVTHADVIIETCPITITRTYTD